MGYLNYLNIIFYWGNCNIYMWSASNRILDVQTIFDFKSEKWWLCCNNTLSIGIYISFPSMITVINRNSIRRSSFISVGIYDTPIDKCYHIYVYYWLHRSPNIIICFNCVLNNWRRQKEHVGHRIKPRFYI